VAAVDHHGAFGQDAFGRRAERAARFFGTPQYIVGQTLVVIGWIILNAVALVSHWDPYPFILLNLMFSVQAAYTGPVLLLAGNRQSQKDRLTLEHAAAEAERCDAQDRRILEEIKHNTEITLRIMRRVELEPATTAE